MAKKKSSSKVFKDEAAMDGYLESHDLGGVFARQGKLQIPKIRKINLDLPEWLIVELDLEASRAGVARQPLMKLWLIQKLEDERRKRVA